jgi:hypothetical protein
VVGNNQPHVLFIFSADNNLTFKKENGTIFPQEFGYIQASVETNKSVINHINQSHPKIEEAHLY